jgi:hypothetical protein
MGRPATGHLSENCSAATGRLTSWGLQFSHAGRRRYLTLPATTRDQALREMAVVMDEVRQGVWVPPRPRRPTPARGAMPSFEKFAGTWVARQKDEGGRRQTGLSAAGQADLQWRFEHLLAHFAWMSMDEIRVRQAKTDAGVRIVHILPVLHGELAEHRDRVKAGPSRLVFCTSSGRPLGASNVRIRVLTRAVQRANAELEAGDRQPLPAGLTPHSLRRTFASLLFAIGEPPTYVMSQMGHTTPALTLALYAREMNRRDGEHAHLRTLIAPRPPQIGAGSLSSTSTAMATQITSQRGTTDRSYRGSSAPADRIQGSAHALEKPALLTASRERHALIDDVQAGGS